MKITKAKGTTIVSFTISSGNVADYDKFVEFTTYLAKNLIPHNVFRYKFVDNSDDTIWNVTFDNWYYTNIIKEEGVLK